MKLRAVVEAAVRAAELLKPGSRRHDPVVTAGLLLRAMTLTEALEHARQVETLLSTILEEDNDIATARRIDFRLIPGGR